MVGMTDGTLIRSASADVKMRERATAPLMVDASLDSDVVYHEYCHGQSWRMIGGMSGVMSGAIGEGNSDLCALLMNPGNDVVGEYSASGSLGSAASRTRTTRGRTATSRARVSTSTARSMQQSAGGSATTTWSTVASAPTTSSTT